MGYATPLPFKKLSKPYANIKAEAARRGISASELIEA
jgi:hypothetical protein